MHDQYDKLVQANRKKMTAAVRKALIAADPRYFSWSTEEQEHFRATMSEVAKRRVQQILLKELLGIHCQIDEVDEAWDEHDSAKLYLLNWGLLLTEGIGEDYIYLNEQMAEGETLLDYSTLYDYDYAEHLYQEEWKKQDIPGYTGSSYHPFRFPPWVRLLVGEDFYYGTFISIATWVMERVNVDIEALIDELIPSRLVRGENHGKKYQGGYIWDMKRDANGLETQLEQLQSRWHAYYDERRLQLSQTHKTLPPTVYIYDDIFYEDPHKYFIFANENTLKQIRWRHFLSDCKPLLQNFVEMESIFKSELDRAKSWLAENHHAIMEN